MNKRKNLTTLEQQIQSLTNNIKTIDELEDLTRQLRKVTLKTILVGEMVTTSAILAMPLMGITSATIATATVTSPLPGC